MQFESVMSMMRDWPAKGTAGLARSRVKGNNLSPAPPASNTPSVSLMYSLYLSQKVQLISQDAKLATSPAHGQNMRWIQLCAFGPTAACAAAGARFMLLCCDAQRLQEG